MRDKKATVYFWHPELDFGDFGIWQVDIQAVLTFDADGDIDSIDFREFVLFKGNDPVDLKPLLESCSEVFINSLKSECEKSYYDLMSMGLDALGASKADKERKLEEES